MPELKNIPVVKTSNFIGDTMDMAAASKFEQVVLVGHIGKLVKLAGGVMNTHSRTADCRTERSAPTPPSAVHPGTSARP